MWCVFLLCSMTRAGLNNNYDPDHGRRAAAYAQEMRGRLFELEEASFELLYKAIAEHADGHVSEDITIGTCFDADRLDLRRVGIEPDPAFISNWQVQNTLRPRS